MASNMLKLSNFEGFIKPEEAAPIFEEAAKTSVVQRLARQIPLGASGKAIPVSTDKPTPAWVLEGEKKPVTKNGVKILTMAPKKIAAIAVVSKEVIRANPGNFLDLYKKELGEAFALAFDLAALHGKATDGTTAGPFETYLAKTSKSVELGTAKTGLYGDLVTGLDLVVKAKKRVNGFVFDSTVEPMFLGALDTTNRPIFQPTVADPSYPTRPGIILGRNAAFADTIVNDTDTDKVVGFAGDWTKCVWGSIGGISWSLSTETTLDTGDGQMISMFQNNSVAILAEAEFSFLCADTDAFVKFANKTV